MHRKQIAVVLAVFAVVLISVSTALGSSKLRGPRVLRFLGVSERFIPIQGFRENGPPRIGAQYVFVDALFNRGAQLGRPNGARVGSVEGLCTLFQPQAAICSFTAHVPDGFVTGSGTTRLDRKESSFAITGGGGAYGNARGTVKITSLSENKYAVLVRLTT